MNDILNSYSEWLVILNSHTVNKNVLELFGVGRFSNFVSPQ